MIWAVTAKRAANTMPILMGVNRMSMMREIPYLLATHYIVIAMRPITFPGKPEAQIIERVGDEMIPHDHPTAARRCVSW